MHAKDYVDALVDELANHAGHGLKDRVAAVEAELERVADNVEGRWHPKENVAEDLSGGEKAVPVAPVETVTPEAAPEKAA